MRIATIFRNGLDLSYSKNNVPLGNWSIYQQRFKIYERSELFVRESYVFYSSYILKHCINEKVFYKGRFGCLYDVRIRRLNDFFYKSLDIDLITCYYVVGIRLFTWLVNNGYPDRLHVVMCNFKSVGKDFNPYDTIGFEGYRFKSTYKLDNISTVFIYEKLF